MDNKQYLIFRWHNVQYGIEAALVQEIFPLPEVTPLPEAPTDILGMLNLRGKLVPMMHLNSLQEHPQQGCNISDYVMVLQWEELQIGIIVHQINDVLELNAEAIQTEHYEQLFGNINTTSISGVAKVEEGKILLLDHKTFISQPDALLPLIWDAQIQLELMASSPTSDAEQPLKQGVSPQSDELQTLKSLPNFYDLYCPSATPEERAIFRQRADSLREPIQSLKAKNELIPLAVIGFSNEFFGLDLELVREFTEISNLTPIPGCPNHIVGNMNLRGEIVTLVDIRNVLNLPATSINVDSQVVVVQVDDIVAGLPVDRVLEMVYLNSADMTPSVAAPSNQGEKYLQGTATFQEKMLKVLDLPKLFTQGDLVVNEEA